MFTLNRIFIAFIIAILLHLPSRSKAFDSVVVYDVTAKALNAGGQFCKLPIFKTTPMSAAIGTILGAGLIYTAERINAYQRNELDFNDDESSYVDEIDELFPDVSKGVKDVIKGKIKKENLDKMSDREIVSLAKGGAKGDDLSDVIENIEVVNDKICNDSLLADEDAADANRDLEELIARLRNINWDRQNAKVNQKEMDEPSSWSEEKRNWGRIKRGIYQDDERGAQ